MSSPSLLAESVVGKYAYLLPVDIQKIISDNGILVDYVATGEEFNGMYMRYPSPLILINSRQSTARQRFTLAHELFHHLSGHGNGYSPCFSISKDRTAEERKARKFAAHLLMPEQAIRSLMALGLDKGKLLQAFLVSQEALDIRLRELRIA